MPVPAPAPVASSRGRVHRGVRRLLETRFVGALTRPHGVDHYLTAAGVRWATAAAPARVVDATCTTPGTVTLARRPAPEAMDIGHNVLHGQYDWMRDPRFDSSTFEWNQAAPAERSRHAHNVVHHVNANVAGVDRDLGHGVVRITDDEPWKPSHLGNPVAALLLAALFDQAIGFHDLEAERISLGLVDPDEARATFEASMAKLRRQALRDFVLIPLLSGRAAPRSFAGAVAAQVVGNVWGFAIILSGHLPADTVIFQPEDLRARPGAGGTCARRGGPPTSAAPSRSTCSPAT